MVRIRNVIVAMLWALAGAGATPAQTEDKPKGLLRQDDEGFYILVRTFAPLPAGSKVFAALTTSKGELLDLETDVQDCPPASPRKICKRTDGGQTELRYRLARAPVADDGFKMRYAITGASGEGKLREVEAQPDFRITGARLVDSCDNGILYTVRAEALPQDKAYLDQRVARFDEWLRRQGANPRGIAAVEIQPHTSANKESYAVQNFRVSPADAGGAPSNHQLDVTRARGASRFDLCVNFQERLPYDKFDTRVKFESNPPFELLFAKTDTLAGLSQLKAVAVDDAKAVVGEKELGLRGFDNSLDVGFMFASAVEDEKQLDMSIKRVRNTVGVFDVRVAPWLRQRRSRPTAGDWQYFVTPVFLDAKVSTGKINKDTHSLNRINIGTEHNFRYVQGTESGKRNKYVLTLRGVNASDRDFKRAELTGEFEFRPIWDALNSPRSGNKRLVTRVLKPDEDPVEVASLNFFGFQLQPFVGINAGRAYRKKRDIFEGEETSDFVRRLYFGTDIVLNLGALFTVTLTDTFYVRGEAPADRGKNYFNGEVEGALGRIRRNTAQSFFVSFERGDQPPFATRGVNSVKVGYRIRSDITKVGTVK